MFRHHHMSPSFLCRRTWSCWRVLQNIWKNYWIWCRICNSWCTRRVGVASLQNRSSQGTDLVPRETNIMVMTYRVWVKFRKSHSISRVYNHLYMIIVSSNLIKLYAFFVLKSTDLCSKLVERSLRWWHRSLNNVFTKHNQNAIKDDLALAYHWTEIAQSH